MTLYKKPPAAPQTRLIGNERVGIIEVPVLGGLTLEEDETIYEVIAQASDDVVMLASKTAERIAVIESMGVPEGEPKVSEVEAYRVIEDSVFHRTLEDRAQGIAIRHAEAITEVRTAFRASETLKARAAVTALLRHRLGEPEIPAKFSRVLFNALAAIADEEQAAEKFPPEPMTAEALGKPPGATAAKKRRTGTPASGS